MLSVRAPTNQDSAPVAALLRRSITELCAADHNHDPARLEHWLNNKTPATFLSWLENPHLIPRIIELGDAVAGFGMANLGGEILLNYVSPDFRFQGISARTLADLEHELFQRGITDLSLSSTETAHEFYARRGWQDHGGPDVDNGMISYPMRKCLSG